MDGPSTSDISRKDLTLVVMEVLKTLKEHDTIPSRSNYDIDDPPSGASDKPETVFSRFDGVRDQQCS